MRFLITAGPTREPIDPVRFISNHSSGQMGRALISAAIDAGHEVTAILGPVAMETPSAARRIDVETTRQMYQAVMDQFPTHDILIMAAAVADYRPKRVSTEKLGRSGDLTLELEATEDIVAAAAASKTPSQQVIGFSLESEGNLDRAKAKLQRKKLDMIVFNPLRTMNSADIQATLLYADGRQTALPNSSKQAFAQHLIQCLSR